MKSFKFWITSTEDGETYHVYEEAKTISEAWDAIYKRFRDSAVDISYSGEVR